MNLYEILDNILIQDRKELLKIKEKDRLRLIKQQQEQLEFQEQQEQEFELQKLQKLQKRREKLLRKYLLLELLQKHQHKKIGEKRKQNITSLTRNNIKSLQKGQNIIVMHQCLHRYYFVLNYIGKVNRITNSYIFISILTNTNGNYIYPIDLSNYDIILMPKLIYYYPQFRKFNQNELLIHSKGNYVLGNYITYFKFKDKYYIIYKNKVINPFGNTNYYGIIDLNLIK